MWERVKLTVLNAAGFLIANPMFAYLTAGLLLLVMILSVMTENCVNRRKRDLERRKEAIQEQKFEANAAANREADARKELDDAKGNTNRAAGDLDAADARDSDEWADIDRRIIADRFCRRFPADSTCKEWRERTGYVSATPGKDP